MVHDNDENLLFSDIPTWGNNLETREPFIEFHSIKLPDGIRNVNGRREGRM